jgi:hypothetical protein
MAEFPYDLHHLLDSSSAGQMRVVAGSGTKQRTATSQAGLDSEVDTDHFNNSLRSSPCCTYLVVVLTAEAPQAGHAENSSKEQ